MGGNPKRMYVAVNLEILVHAEFSNRRLWKEKEMLKNRRTQTYLFKFIVFNVIGCMITQFDVLWLFHDGNEVEIRENTRKLQNNL